MIGIDKKIDQLRTTLDTYLWTAYTFAPLGRAYVNTRDGRKVPEILSSGNEYSEVLLNDTVQASSFCVVGNDYDIEDDVATGTVTLYVAVNLTACYPTVTERAVEYVHRDVSAVLKHSDFTLKKVLNGWGDFESNYQNMQPFYLCRFECEIEFLFESC